MTSRNYFLSSVPTFTKLKPPIILIIIYEDKNSQIYLQLQRLPATILYYTSPQYQKNYTSIIFFSLSSHQSKLHRLSKPQKPLRARGSFYPIKNQSRASQPRSINTRAQDTQYRAALRKRKSFKTRGRERAPFFYPSLSRPRARALGNSSMQRSLLSSVTVLYYFATARAGYTDYIPESRRAEVVRGRRRRIADKKGYRRDGFPFGKKFLLPPPVGYIYIYNTRCERDI